jgi:hypothetical protein
MSAIKAAVLELAQKLPDDCTWDDVMQQNLRSPED